MPLTNLEKQIAASAGKLKGSINDAIGSKYQNMVNTVATQAFCEELKNFGTTKVGRFYDEFYQKQFQDPNGKGKLALKEAEGNLQEIQSYKSKDISAASLEETKDKDKDKEAKERIERINREYKDKIEEAEKVIKELKKAENLAYLAQERELAEAIYSDLSLPKTYTVDTNGQQVEKPAVPFIGKDGVPIEKAKLDSAFKDVKHAMRSQYSVEQKEGTDTVKMTSEEPFEGRPPYRGADALLGASAAFGGGGQSKKLNFDNVVTITPGVEGSLESRGSYQPWKDEFKKGNELQYLAYGLSGLGHQVIIKNPEKKKSIDKLNKELGQINEIYVKLRKKEGSPTPFEVYKEIANISGNTPEQNVKLQLKFARGLVYEGSDSVKAKFYGKKLNSFFEKLETSKEVNDFIKMVGPENINKIDRGSIASQMHLISTENQRMINAAWKKEDKNKPTTVLAQYSMLTNTAYREFLKATQACPRGKMSLERNTPKELVQLESLTYLSDEQMARMKITDDEINDIKDNDKALGKDENRSIVTELEAKREVFSGNFTIRKQNEKSGSPKQMKVVGARGTLLGMITAKKEEMQRMSKTGEEKKARILPESKIPAHRKGDEPDGDDVTELPLAGNQEHKHKTLSRRDEELVSFVTEEYLSREENDSDEEIDEDPGKRGKL